MSPKTLMPKLQHYVPQFILRNFTTGKGNQIFVFDKQEEVAFRTNIRNIASESAFYNFAINGYQFTIEPGLEKHETQTAEVFGKAIRERSLSSLGNEDRVTIATFIAIQIYRTRYFRDKIADMNRGLTERIRQYGFDPDKVKGHKLLDEKGVKDFSIKMLMKNSEQLVPHILDKKWLLYETRESDPLFISDNPVARQNRQDFGPFWGNLGLAVKGIEIYLPLSKTLSLAMLCQSHEETFHDTYKKAEFLRTVIPGFERKLPVDPEWLENLKRGFEEGVAIPLTAENVVNQNSLQVKWSSRFVFSSKEDFSLVREMISADPRYKSGMAIRIS